MAQRLRLGAPMIHYHGGPVWPTMCAYKLWRARHAFVSFARPEQMDVAAEVSQSFAIDNGAFSAWKSGALPDWDAYYAFVDGWRRHPGFDFAIIPDTIDGSEARNSELVEEWPFGQHGVPVWHLHESMEWLRYLAGKFGRIALGSSGAFDTIGTGAWFNRMAEAMREICDDKGRPITRIHGLRMLNPDVFSRFPFASADSTNVAQNITIDSKWKGTYTPASKETRALLLAERIEQTNGASEWTNAGIQESLI